MEKVIEIDYAPRRYFELLHESTERWKVVVAHRRAGKTVACINHLQRDALRIPNSRFAYIAPTYKQAKNVAWDILKHYAKDIPNTQFNEAELRADYPNGSRITLYGADNPDTLRGIGLWGVIFDEYSQQPSNIFTEIIRPALADHQGYAIWIGTPKGKNDFWRLHDKAQSDKTWLSMLLTVEDTKILPKEEIDDAKGIMDEDEFKQEFYCSFEASIKGAYYAAQLSAAREDNRITNVPYDRSVPVYTFWDIGISDATAIGFFQRVGKEHHMIDYYENSGEPLEHYAKVIQNKEYVYATHYLPHDARARSKQTGKSYEEAAKELGLNVDVTPLTDIIGGINQVRSMFNQLWIDKERCQLFLDAIALYRKEWDDNRGEFKNKPYHDWTSHAADMLRGWGVTTFTSPTSTVARAPIKQYRPKFKGYA